MHLICNCQSGTVEESAETWMFATSGSAGPRRADKLSKIFFFTFSIAKVFRKLTRTLWRGGIFVKC